MRINLLAFGTRGDVQPAIALGVGLRKAGHSVQLAALEEFRTLTGMYGLDFFPLQASVQDLLNPSLAGMVDSGAAVFRLLPELINLFRESFRQMTIDFLESSQGAEVLISNPATALLAAVVAEKLGVAHIQTSVFPGWPTRAFPSIFWPWPTRMMMSEKSLLAKMRGAFNRLTYFPAAWLVALGLQPMVQRCRTEILGLPRRRRKGPFATPAVLELAAFSEQVLPRPTDWGKNIHVTGYWFLDSPGYIPPPSLRDFLDGGPPPVYVGFGSMPSRDPEQALGLITRAFAMTGQRAIILTGYGPFGQGLAEQKKSKDIFYINSIPHDWLLPRVAAVVHHGGAGTTAAGIRAGVPGILIPVMGDQLFWGQRVADLGIGPRPIPRKRLSAESLASAIHQAVSDQAMRQRAAALGEKIRAEDGVGRAVDIIYNSA